MTGATATGSDAVLLALDWGTTALRGARIDSEGQVLEQRSFARGILTVPAGEFVPVFDSLFGDWARRGASLCLISGMAGSKQGWIEAPYCQCPAGLADVTARLCWVTDPQLAIPTAIVPGLSCESRCDLPGLATLPDVMRGEEIQILGALHLLGQQDGLFVLPGTHNKWARVENARVTGFQTFMTGEFYALLSQHSLLARSIDREAAFDEATFTLGLARARQGAGLLHNAFGTRTLSLFERLNAAQLASYLSGLVIGEELRSQDLGSVAEVVLIGSETLTSRYALAIDGLGPRTRCLGADATWAGHHALARQLRKTP